MSIQAKGTVTKLFAGITVVNVKGDLGANFGNVADELAKYPLDASAPFQFAIMENTNATGAGTRWYVYAPGTGWKGVLMGL